MNVYLAYIDEGTNNSQHLHNQNITIIDIFISVDHFFVAMRKKAFINLKMLQICYMKAFYRKISQYHVKYSILIGAIETHLHIFHNTIRFGKS